MPIKILKNPYRANFNTIDAKTILPDTLASEWAKGNQICTGTNGVFTEKDTNSTIHIISCNN